ncbi:MAG: hypothetical protein AAF378_24965 [Cyanobacteria bacterium P01_A01_bin.84]
MATQKAKFNSQQAYKLALKIADAWYCTQALSWVARYANDDHFDKFIRRACQASFSDSDPYKIVGSSAWVIRAIIERKKYQYIDPYLPKLLTVSSTISNPVCRGDALFLQYQAIFPISKKSNKQLQLVLANLLSACRDMNSWKKPLIIRNTALIMGNKDLGQAFTIVNELSEGRVKRQVQKYLSEKKFLSPRDFFW